MHKALLIVLVLLMSASDANACIWDRDTLAMERARFPEVNELIAGYFPRHSPAYYAWRKEQVLAIPLADRKASDYDDLGASYDKLGEHEQAIQTILDKMERFPDEGVYESHANLGTFYIHNGDLEKGAELIGKAIEINPDAHFGREVYQKLLVEYVIETRAFKSISTQDELSESDFIDEVPNFARFLFKRLGIDEDYASQALETDRAIKGILGMMRFGNYESPILLKALGDLLLLNSMDTDGPQRLAARAYLKASYAPEAAHKSTLLRSRAERALHTQEGESLERIEENLRKEIAEGDAYFAQIEADEKAWIAAGEDVDALFNKKYYNDAPEYSQSMLADTRDRVRAMPLDDKLFYLAMAVGLSVLICVVVIVFRVRRMRSRRREIAVRLQEA